MSGLILAQHPDGRPDTLGIVGFCPDCHASELEGKFILGFQAAG